MNSLRFEHCSGLNQKWRGRKCLSDSNSLILVKKIRNCVESGFHRETVPAATRCYKMHIPQTTLKIPRRIPHLSHLLHCLPTAALHVTMLFQRSLWIRVYQIVKVSLLFGTYMFCEFNIWTNWTACYTNRPVGYLYLKKKIQNTTLITVGP